MSDEKAETERWKCFLCGFSNASDRRNCDGCLSTRPPAPLSQPPTPEPKWGSEPRWAHGLPVNCPNCDAPLTIRDERGGYCTPCKGWTVEDLANRLLARLNALQSRLQQAEEERDAFVPYSFSASPEGVSTVFINDHPHNEPAISAIRKLLDMANQVQTLTEERDAARRALAEIVETGEKYGSDTDPLFLVGIARASLSPAEEPS